VTEHDQSYTTEDAADEVDGNIVFYLACSGIVNYLVMSAGLSVRLSNACNA